VVLKEVKGEHVEGLYMLNCYLLFLKAILVPPIDFNKVYGNLVWERNAGDRRLSPAGRSQDILSLSVSLSRAIGWRERERCYEAVHLLLEHPQASSSIFYAATIISKREPMANILKIGTILQDTIYVMPSSTSDQDAVVAPPQAKNIEISALQYRPTSYTIRTLP
jgi:hypothetical protein